MTETTAPAPVATPADLAAADVMTWRGAVMTADQAREIGDLLSEFDDTGTGAAVRALAVYWADRTTEVIRAGQAANQDPLPADVLAWAPALGGESLLIDAMINAGVPAPDCEATEAVVAEAMELVIRRLCAERAGLCAGGLNRILAALETAADDDDPDCEPDDALSRLADRIAELAGGDVAAPGGIGFTVS
jgi:hypothetical protein